MGKIRYIIATVAAFACLSGVARAGLIDLGIRSLPSVLGNAAAEASFIQADQGLSGALSCLNKYDYGGGWDGGAVSSTGFSVDPNSGETSNGNLTWNLTGSGHQLSYILVKNGRSSGFFHYRLYAVTADSLFSGSGLVTINGSRGISHISFFGQNGINSVPEGGATCALLGMAITGLWFARRFVREV